MTFSTVSILTTTLAGVLRVIGGGTLGACVNTASSVASAPLVVSVLVVVVALADVLADLLVSAVGSRSACDLGAQPVIRIDDDAITAAIAPAKRGWWNFAVWRAFMGSFLMLGYNV